MTDAHPDEAHGGSDGLWRWLVGGLLGGAAILGLLVAAYAVGYHRGKDHRASAAPPAATSTPAATTTTTASATTTAAAPTGGPVVATPALVASGKALFTSDSCSGCHSLSGATGAGPALNGIAGSTVALDNGQTVTADDAYLERSIADPDAQIVKGFQKGIMSSAIASFGLSSKPDDVRALVAYIKSNK
jgi:cytochrome c2